jgi:hypothetical protein
MKALVAVTLAACTSSPTTLPDDAYFFQPVGYVCEPSASAECRFELAFCTDGSFQFWAGDVERGTYQLEDGVAEGSDVDAGFAFDFATQELEPASVPFFSTDTVYAVSCP